MSILQKPELLDLIANQSINKRVLQIGIAHGHSALELLKKGVCLTGGDISWNYISGLREKAVGGNFTQLDILNLPFADNSFDMIVCLEVLEHIKDYDRAIKQMSRILTPGGVLFISVPTLRTERIFEFFFPKWLDICQHVNVFRMQDLVEVLSFHGIETEKTYKSNFHASFFWIFHSILHTRHDGTGKIDGNFWMSRMIETFWRILLKLRLAKVFDNLGTIFFPKSRIYLGRKSILRDFT